MHTDPWCVCECIDLVTFRTAEEPRVRLVSNVIYSEGTGWTGQTLKVSTGNTESFSLEDGLSAKNPGLKID